MQESEPFGLEPVIHGADPGDVGTRPTSTGSTPVLNTIGIIAVAALAASAAELDTGVAITVTRRRTRSDAILGIKSSWPLAQRYSILTLRPSTKPASPNPRRNPTILSCHSAADTVYNDPTSGNAGCCACAASGSAAAAPPTRLRNLRRRKSAPKLRRQHSREMEVANRGRPLTELPDVVRCEDNQNDDHSNQHSYLRPGVSQ